jgi:hypothetical protein
MKFLVYKKNPDLFRKRVLVIDIWMKTDKYACFELAEDESCPFSCGEGAPGSDSDILYVDPSFQLTEEILEEMDDPDTRFKWVKLSNQHVEFIDVFDTNESMITMLQECE